MMKNIIFVLIFLLSGTAMAKHPARAGLREMHLKRVSKAKFLNIKKNKTPRTVRALRGLHIKKSSMIKQTRKGKAARALATRKCRGNAEGLLCRAPTKRAGT